MVDVNFEEQSWQPEQRYSSGPAQMGNGSKMTGWLLKLGIVKNPGQASYILIGVAVLFFALSIYFFMSAGGGGPSSNIGPTGPGGGPVGAEFPPIQGNQ